MVLHRSSTNTLCAVTWSAPSKFNVEYDPYRNRGRIGIFDGDRVTMLHTEGTHLSTYEVTREHKRYYTPDRTTMKNADSWEASDNFDTDLLEPEGLKLMISIVQKTCLRIGVIWELRREFLERYQRIKAHPTPPPVDISPKSLAIHAMPKPAAIEDDTSIVCTSVMFLNVC